MLSRLIMVDHFAIRYTYQITMLHTLQRIQWQTPIITLFQKILLECKFAIKNEIFSGQNYFHMGLVVP